MQIYDAFAENKMFLPIDLVADFHQDQLLSLINLYQFGT